MTGIKWMVIDNLSWAKDIGHIYCINVDGKTKYTFGVVEYRDGRFMAFSDHDRAVFDNLDAAKEWATAQYVAVLLEG